MTLNRVMKVVACCMVVYDTIGFGVINTSKHGLIFLGWAPMPAQIIVSILLQIGVLYYAFRKV